MSRWFPDRWLIALAPDQVVIERYTLTLTLAGLRSRLLERQALTIDREAGRGSWGGALRALAGLMKGGDRHGVATVILANSLVRYALVPSSDLLNAEQEAAVLRHCFNEIYGTAAEQWQLRISTAPGRALQVASGVDRALLDELRTLFPGDRLRLRSIQPRLMAVCNDHRAALAKAVTGPAWLLLVEPDNLCLGLIAEGALTTLRGMRCGPDWAIGLSGLLERDACLADLDDAPGDVFCWHRDGTTTAIPEAAALHLHPLLDRPLPVSAIDGPELAVAGG